jgi:hypothetical protein
MTFDAEIECVGLQDENGEPVTVVKSGTTAKVIVDVRFHKPVSRPIFSLTIRTPDGRMVYDTTTDWMHIGTPDFSAGERCRVVFLIVLHLLDGEYQLGVDIASAGFSHYFDRLERAMGFWVKGTDGAKGLADLEADVKFEKIAPAEAV